MRLVVIKGTVFAAMLLYGGMAVAQSVETYFGHQRAGVDLMWFRNFTDAQGERSPFLFFSRNRASTDYDSSPTAFGSTNAVSYNFKSGWGVVAAGSYTNAGFTPKAGVQCVKMKGDFLFFGWLVADLKQEGNLDLFGMFRWQPKLGKADWRLFSQLELFSVFNPENGVWNITQRIRAGVKKRTWATGLMADFNQAGKTDFIQTNNLGAFLRHDF